MKQIDCKNAIRPIYHLWQAKKENKGGEAHGLLFYGFLKNERPDLLQFRYSGDKYQLVNIWVQEWRKYL